MRFSNTEELSLWVSQAERLWLFLDYDGTLAEFTPSPEDVAPDPEVAEILTQLAARSWLRVVVLSGRRLDHLQALIPAPGVFLAGTYGVELQTPFGDRIARAKYDEIRPYLERIKPQWKKIIEDKQGFFLEDKGWALALHARFAGEAEAKEVISAARGVLGVELPPESFRLLKGHKFLEIAPIQAQKGKMITYMFFHFPWPRARLVYLGDDDKDAEAFGVIHTHQGVVIRIASNSRHEQFANVDFVLEAPWAVRQWLRTLLELEG